MKAARFFASVALALALAVFGAVACETTSMSAKSGPDAVVQGSGKDAVCARKVNARSQCDDTVGCFWDESSGACTSH